jgi:hypothetical protein
MGFLDQYEADGSVPSGIRQQIRDAYASLLEDYQRRDAAGERLTPTDLIAYQFLLETSGIAHLLPLPRLQAPFSPPRASVRLRAIAGTSQSAASIHSD